MIPGKSLRLVSKSGSTLLRIDSSNWIKPPRCTRLEIPEGAAGAWITNLRYRGTFEATVKTDTDLSSGGDIRISIRRDASGLLTITESGRARTMIREDDIPVLLPSEVPEGFTRNISFDRGFEGSNWSVTDTEVVSGTARDAGIASLDMAVNVSNGIKTVSGSAILLVDPVKLDLRRRSIRVSEYSSHGIDESTIEQAKEYLRSKVAPPNYFEEQFNVAGNRLGFTFRALAGESKIKSLSIRFSYTIPTNLKVVECVNQEAYTYRIGKPAVTGNLTISVVVEDLSHVPTVKHSYITSFSRSVDEVMLRDGTVYGYRVSDTYQFKAPSYQFLDLEGAVLGVVAQV